MLKSLGLLSIAALCLVVLSPNQGLAQSSSAKPVGTWERRTKEVRFLLTIKEDQLHILIEKDNETMATVDADYSVSREGILYGVVIFLEDEDRKVKSDLPFCCRYRVDGDELTIRDGKLSDGDLDKLTGRYHRVEEKISRTKGVPTKPICEQKTGCCPPKCCNGPVDVSEYEIQLEPPSRDLRSNVVQSDESLDARLSKESCHAAPAVTVKTGAIEECHDVCRTVIMGTVSLPVAASCSTPPADSEVLRALESSKTRTPSDYEENHDDIQIVTERVADRVDDARFYPLIGPACLHHSQYKCSVYYNETVSSSFPFPIVVKHPRVEVVYIDKDHLDPVAPAK